MCYRWGSPTRTVVFIGSSFPTYLLWIRRPSGLRGRPANETYDAGLSLDVDRRIADNFVYSPGLGKHRHMARCYFCNLGIHTLRQESFQFRLYGSIIRSNNIRCWLKLPRGTRNGLTKKIGQWCHLRSPNELLLRLGQVSCKFGNAGWTKPYAPLHHFDVLENRCGRVLVLIDKCCVAVLRCKGAYINKRFHSLVGAGCRDDGATIRMTDENNRAAGARERSPYCGRVVSNGVEMVLRRDHLKAIGQEQRNDLAVT